LGDQVSLFQDDHQRYPSNLDELIGDYVERLSSDPWGNEYQIEHDGNKATIFTYRMDRANGKYLVRFEYDP